MLTSLDQQRLEEALSWAERGIGLTDPNPRVGCVIGRDDGTLLGAGHTQQAGGPHAEVMALRDAAGAGLEVRGATAWVTLEPCAHHGRTPPCCDALIAAGLARVVVATRDPHPQVNGEGLRRLAAAGLQVDLLDPNHDLAVRVARLNVGFLHRIATGRPWVRLKTAISLDGRTALLDGRSHWITSEAARQDGHAWRRRAGAVLTGVGTVLADDPRLDVRLVPTARQPLRVVVDSQWRLPAKARLLDPPGEVLQVGVVPSATLRRVARCSDARQWMAPATPDGQVDLAALLAHLGTLPINELHVEAGPTLSGALLRSGLVDELLVYIAPMLIGPGLPLAQLPEAPALSALARWQVHAVDRIGPDVRLMALAPSERAP
ncbi:MAG: bifunctional diaminohydroxyphosphoribosylaminopyrimidine deaminase/5-amino-6-(5-phosphoribosylamino)uracil reductase RibD [Rubrivivax sp.]|jgi:diaminohydroxyphosphoribosylaminopyrimidine deaminase/5-amino-6-(5-phosphoribosylamino)uracil reductase